MTAKTRYFIILTPCSLSVCNKKLLNPPNRGTRKSGSGRNGSSNKNNLTENNKDKCRYFSTTQEKHKLRYKQGSIRKPVIVAKHGEIPTSNGTGSNSEPCTKQSPQRKADVQRFWHKTLVLDSLSPCSERSALDNAKSKDSERASKRKSKNRRPREWTRDFSRRGSDCRVGKEEEEERSQEVSCSSVVRNLLSDSPHDISPQFFFSNFVMYPKWRWSIGNLARCGQKLNMKVKSL